MKYILLILFALLFFSTQNSQAQNTNALEMRTNFFGSKFYKGDTIISVNQVLDEMSPNESIYNLMISAKEDYVLAQLLSAAGGFMVGWPVGTAIGGGEPNWTMAGIGAGIIAISIPISANFKKKGHSAINQHNDSITASHGHYLKPIYSIGFGGTSFKMQIKF